MTLWSVVAYSKTYVSAYDDLGSLRCSQLTVSGLPLIRPHSGTFGSSVLQ